MFMRGEPQQSGDGVIAMGSTIAECGTSFAVFGTAVAVSGPASEKPTYEE
jgi:hypothetical protein